MARIVRTSRPHAVVCTLARTSPLTRASADGRDVSDAGRELRADLRAYLARHEGVTSIQVVASARRGGYTVEQYDRSDLV